MRLGALMAALALGGCGAGEAPPLTIAAAANLESVLPRLTEAFERETGIESVVSFGATRALGQQIENGAPFDLFLSADTAEVDRLIGLGRIEADSRRVYARGVLALWSPSGEITSLEDLRGVRFVAMAKPEFAPYGRAAREALQNAGLWDEIEPKTVYGQNVRMARQFAESGNADAALIALSLTEGLPGVVTEIPAELYEPIEQGLGVVSGGQAEAFAGWLSGNKARSILVAGGYHSSNRRAARTPHTTISRDALQEMFDSMRARARWNIDDTCLWGYFFTDHDRQRLLTAATELEKAGYTVVGVLEPTPDDDDQELLFLHVEREEQHTVESLDARNRDLYRFAEQFKLESYDGMDVGPVK